MYKIELKSNNSYFEKRIVKELLQNSSKYMGNVKHNKNKYKELRGLSDDFLFSEVLSAFLTRYRDYTDDYKSEHIDSLEMYVACLIKNHIRWYNGQELSRQQKLVPLTDVSENGVDYLNTKECSVELYNQYVDIDTTYIDTDTYIRELYKLGLMENEEYTLIIYMLHLTNLEQLISYREINGTVTSPTTIKRILNKYPQILTVVNNLNNITNEEDYLRLMDTLRDRINNIDNTDKFIGIVKGDDNK